MNRKIILGLSAGVAVAAILSFAIWKDDSEEGSSRSTTEVITLGTFSKALGNLPYHVARHFNWFAAAPELAETPLRHIEFNDRPAISQAFDAGDLQALFSAEIPAMLCFAQGNAIKIVEYSAVAAQEIVVPVDSDIQSVAQLPGRDLAVLPGTSSHYCLLKVLRQHDIQPASLDIAYISPSEAKIAFETGRLSAWAVWAPWVEQQEVAGKGRPLPDSKANIASVMTLSRDFATERPSTARALVAVIRRAKLWIQQNPAQAQRIAADELDLDIDVVRQAWPKFDWSINLSASELSDLQDKADFLATTESTRLNRTIDVQAVVDDSFWQQ